MRFQSLKAFVQSLFVPSVDECVTLFTKAQRKLVAVAKFHEERAHLLRNQAQHVMSLAYVAEHEADRAVVISRRLKALTEAPVQPLPKDDLFI